MHKKNLNFIEKLLLTLTLTMLFTMMASLSAYAQDAPPEVVNPFADEEEDDAPPVLALAEDTVTTTTTVTTIPTTVTTVPTPVVATALPETGPSVLYLLGLAGLAMGRKIYRGVKK